MPKYPQNMCYWDFKPTFNTSSKESKWWYIYARPMCALFCQGASGEVVSIISEIDFCLKVEILQKAGSVIQWTSWQSSIDNTWKEITKLGLKENWPN